MQTERKRNRNRLSEPLPSLLTRTECITVNAASETNNYFHLAKILKVIYPLLWKLKRAQLYRLTNRNLTLGVPPGVGLAPVGKQHRPDLLYSASVRHGLLCD